MPDELPHPTREYSSTIRFKGDPALAGAMDQAIEKRMQKIQYDLNRDLWAESRPIGYCYIPEPPLVRFWNRWWGRTRWRWDWPTRIAVYKEDSGLEGFAAIMDEDDDA